MASHKDAKTASKDVKTSNVVNLRAAGKKPHVKPSNAKREGKARKRLTKQHMAAGVKMLEKLHEIAKLAGPLLAKRERLSAEKKAFDAKYSLVDVKGQTSQSSTDLAMALNESEIKELRSIARSTFGFKPVALNLHSTFYFNSNGAGLLAGVISLDPTGGTEFAAMASLFDEYKVVGGEYQYGLLAATQNTGASINSYGVIGYDPSDGTAPATLIGGSQLQQHQLCFKTIFATTIGLTVLRSNHQRFTFKVPPGVVTETGNPITAGTSNWQPTVGPSPQPYGWLKAYFDNMLPVSSACLSGQLTYHCEFRCRE